MNRSFALERPSATRKDVQIHDATQVDVGPVFDLVSFAYPEELGGLSKQRCGTKLGQDVACLQQECPGG